MVNKPATWTSFDVVRKLKFKGPFKKIGHAGTLDPLAEGLLIVCVGKYTKKIEYFQSLHKVYTGSFVLGKTTPSIDLETEFDGEYPIDHIDVNEIPSVAARFLGPIEQTPPLYSAVKQDGQRLYVHARKGKTDAEVAIKKRMVEVYGFEVDAKDFPKIGFKITCSKGTYIRSLVRDFGQALGSGAYLHYLNRAAIGPYTIENAQEIATFDTERYELLSDMG